jgi:hypothetical protein
MRERAKAGKGQTQKRAKAGNAGKEVITAGSKPNASCITFYILLVARFKPVPLLMLYGDLTPLY